MEEFFFYLLVFVYFYRFLVFKCVCIDSYDQGLFNIENVVDVL